MLTAIRQAGGEGYGITLSPEQKMVCEGDGFNVDLQDYKTVKPSSIGQFDGVVSIGAFEHFCSIEEYLAGEQENIYRNFPTFGNSRYCCMEGQCIVPNRLRQGFAASREAQKKIKNLNHSVSRRLASA